MRHIGLYGEIRIPKGRCNDCNQNAFIVENKFQCCGKWAPISNYQGYQEFRRYSAAYNLRHQPKLSYQKEQLERQHNRCFYCGLDFEKKQWNTKKVAYLNYKLNWDHCIPYSFIEDNREINFVAACSICNGIKSNKMFDSLKECREYVIKRRKEKGFMDHEDMSDLFGTFFYEQSKEAFL